MSESSTTSAETVPAPASPFDGNPYSRPVASVAGPVDRRRFWIEMLPVAGVAFVAVPLLVATFAVATGGNVPAFVGEPGFLGTLAVCAVAAATTMRILALPRWVRYTLTPLATAALLVAASIVGDALL